MQLLSKTEIPLRRPAFLTCSPSHPLCPQLHFHTEPSQNHRVVGVGRDLCGSSSPTPCPSRVTQGRLHRTLSRRVCNISREGDSTASLGSLGQGSVTLRGKKYSVKNQKVSIIIKKPPHHQMNTFPTCTSYFGGSSPCQVNIAATIQSKEVSLSPFHHY